MISTFDNLHTSFNIQSVNIPGRVILAPMDGFTDSPFREICRSYGSCISISEFINGMDILYGHPRLGKKIFFKQIERPFAFQIYDDDPDRLIDSAKKLLPYQPDFIDVNMGCASRSVSNRGAGSGLLKNPLKVGMIINALVSALPVPVTAKIRLGWDFNSKNFIEIVNTLQDNGASAIFVHARTRQQGFSGDADWNAIAEIKQVCTIPVIGNGDVNSLEVAKNKMSETNCDAVMIGRAALGNPWVFSLFQISQISDQEVYEVIKEHLSLMCNLYSTRLGTILFRKHLTKYLSSKSLTKEVKKILYTIEEPYTLIQNLEKIVIS